jgi:hypothetical protein
MQHNRDLSPIRARQWNIPDKFENPLPFSGGKPVGSVSKMKKNTYFRFTVKEREKVVFFKCWKISTFANELEALAFVRKFRDDYSQEHGLGINAVRYISPTVMEMKVGKKPLFSMPTNTMKSKHSLGMQ